MTRLENENAFLRQELERRAEELAEMRRIVAGLVQRVPELEAPSERRESPVNPSDKEGNGGSPEQEERSSWWRRFFGIE